MANSFLYHFLPAIMVGATTAALMRVLHQRKCLLCGLFVGPASDPRMLPWYGHLISVIWLVLMALTLGHWDRRVRYVIIIITLAIVVCIYRTVQSIIKQRPQFTLSDMLLFTAFVAAVCSACHYIPVVPLLAFLFLPAIEWSKQRACHHGLALPEATFGSLAAMNPQAAAAKRAKNLRNTWYEVVSPVVILLLYFLVLHH